MKPKSDLQEQIVKYNKELPKITKEQVDWGYNKLLDDYFTTSYKTNIHCLECGHRWKDNAVQVKILGETTCPKCGANLKEANYSKYSVDYNSFNVITTHKGFQVIKLIWIDKYLKKDKPANYRYSEVMQIWINKLGHITVISKLKVNNYVTYMEWSLSSKMEIRSCYKNKVYKTSDFTYPKFRILPIIKRNGFKTSFHRLHPFMLLHGLLTDSKIETLFKLKKYELLKYYFENDSHQKLVQKYWNSLKITFRNNYDIIPNMYFDYLKELEHFGKDINNAHYICPKKFYTAHGYYTTKRREEIAEANRIENEKLNLQRKEQLLIDNRNFVQSKGNLLNIFIKSGTIEIRPLQNLQDFQEEGEMLNHCVYSSKYYKEEKSLCLSAKVDNERMETIELSLKDFTILQARGYDNKPSEYHNKIINVLKKNINLIKQAI